MTRPLIVSIDLIPDFSGMTDSTVESLCDQAFIQLEDGPLVEGLFAYYLSLQAEIEDRQAFAAHRSELPARQSIQQPVSA